MPLIRILIIGVGIWLFYILIKNYLQRRKLEKDSTLNTKASEGMVVKCETCGVYVPENEAVKKNGKTYCCNAHCPDN